MIVAAGLILAFVLIAVFSNRATRHCRWRENRAGAATTWHCAYCGATTGGERGQPPQTCHRARPGP